MTRHYIQKVTYCVLFLFTLIHFSNNTSLSIFEQKKYKKLSENIGLYSLNDDVEILTAENFKNELYNNERAWVVEFYNSWCGFCQRFAPSWKAFATDVKGWKSVVGIGVMDCANDENTPICREFEIMAYPTIKYFYENYKEGPKNLGEKFSVGSHAHEHRQKVLEVIQKEQTEGRGKHFPDILPYVDSDLKELFKSGTENTFLIIQKEDDHIGSEVIMDLHKIKNIRFSFSNNTELINKFGIKDFPALIFVEKDETFQIIKTEGKREAYRTAIEKYVHPKKVISDYNIVKLDHHDNTNEPSMNEFLETREKQALKERIKKMGDVVFQMDLEAALRYSLRHEVATVKEITKEKLTALKIYLNVLSKYFPFGRNGRIFLQDLKDFVWYKTTVKGDDIAKILMNAEKEDQLVFSSPHHWLGCKGSSNIYRGYPCGLWKMFHYLTVNAADYNEGVKGSNYKIVLEAMHGYIKHFFGCTDCSQHFQDMAKKRELSKVTSWDDSILWLWMAHNEVNKRLSGDQTEDPEYPKYQFPSKNSCPRCYDKDDSWNVGEVLYYLKHMYSNINIRYIGSDTRILHLGLDGSHNYSTESGLFKTLDTTMCFILYVASFILILVVIYMFLKRGYRKKVYHHDLLGKV